MKRSLLALVLLNALIGFCALVASLAYILLHRSEEAELLLLIILLVICCINGVTVAIFRREAGDQLELHKEIRDDLARIASILERPDEDVASNRVDG